ncbi:MAG: AEC family transporter [Clostridiales bacterium]|nr:AEC family transporter [Clostridiales bacterium]
MSVFATMAETQALMFLYLLVGAILSRGGYVREEGREGMIALLIRVVMPCSVLSPFLSGIAPEHLSEGAMAMAISAAYCLGSWGIGNLLWRREPAGRREVLIFSTMLPNLGNAGLPINSLVFGAPGVFYTSMQMTSSTVIAWTAGPAIYGRRGKPAEILRAVLLNPNVVAVFLGFFFILTGLRLPGIVTRAVSGFAGMTAPLSMALIGAALSQVHVKELLRADLLLLCAVRLAVLPVAAMVIMRLLGVPETLLRVSTVLVAMPVANYTAIQAEMYGGDHHLASAIIFLTTLLSLVTVPMITLLF